MIHYDLICKHGHKFDGWFSSSAAYDSQRQSEDVLCPNCGTTEVEKQLMTPGIPRKGNSKSGNRQLVLIEQPRAVAQREGGETNQSSDDRARGRQTARALVLRPDSRDTAVCLDFPFGLGALARLARQVPVGLQRRRVLPATTVEHVSRSTALSRRRRAEHRKHDD